MLGAVSSDSSPAECNEAYYAPPTHPLACADKVLYHFRAIWRITASCLNAHATP